MANFLSGALGGQDIAKTAGRKAGTFVEDTVKNIISREKKDGKEKKGGGGGFGVEDALSLVSGKKVDKKGGGGGFGVEDTLSLVSGKKSEKKEGGGEGSGARDVPPPEGGKKDDTKEDFSLEEGFSFDAK